MKLRTKTSIMILLPVFLVFLTVSTIIGIDVYTTEKKNALILLETISRNYANEIKVELEMAMETSKSIAYASEALIERGAPEREDIISVLNRTLRGNDNLLGVWVCFEPNAFDGKDSEFVSKNGYDQTGRFIPYVYREQNTIKTDYLKNYTKEGEGDFYLLALKSGRETVLEPFEYEIDGNHILMTTFAVPIKYHGKIIGVAGVDMTLEQLQVIGDKVKLYQTGYGRVISAKGNVIVHPDLTTIGKPSGEFKTGDAERILNRIKAGEVFSENAYSQVYNGKALKSFAPVTIGETDTPWFFSTVVTEKEVLADVLRLTLKMIVIDLVSV